ncbi:hypothetical protein F2Q65_15075 [Thiohalocapsa marina]|uniref:Uncharacterized protein n=2 Tax=Thiohalocapsa marina TaxID=424902 RepID=A0A5M8FMG1_9GAMM|nr:hypothetical protein F2Q65_15075 [Thiohalocapsa marina]
MELPETPPWEAAEQRRQAMLEKYNEYRSIIEAMTDEQKEAISALFGGQRAPMRSPMHGYGRPPVHPGMMPRGPMPGAPMPGAAEPEAAPQAETQPAG